MRITVGTITVGTQSQGRLSMKFLFCLFFTSTLLLGPSVHYANANAGADAHANANENENENTNVVQESTAIAPALLEAIENSDFKKIQQLVEQGTSISIKEQSYKSRNILMQYIQKGGFEHKNFTTDFVGLEAAHIISFFISHGDVSLNDTDADGNTAAHLYMKTMSKAQRLDYAGVIWFTLFDLGANPNIKNKQGEDVFALHKKAQNILEENYYFKSSNAEVEKARRQMREIFIELTLHANNTIQNKTLNTIIWRAHDYNHTDGLYTDIYIQQLEAIFKETNIDINSKPNGATALEVAMGFKSPKIIQWLLLKGARVGKGNILNSNMFTIQDLQWVLGTVQMQFDTMQNSSHDTQHDSIENHTKALSQYKRAIADIKAAIQYHEEENRQHHVAKARQIYKENLRQHYRKKEHQRNCQSLLKSQNT